MRPPAHPPSDAPLRADAIAKAIAAARRAYGGVIALSAVLNVFMLTGSLFMLQVYDRVLASRSLPTLAALLVLVGLVYALLGVIDVIRARLLVRIADRFEEDLGAGVMGHALDLASLGIAGLAQGEAGRPVQDLDRVRHFIAGPGAAALADLPWIPIYVAVAFLFHAALGLLALVSLAVLVVLTLLSERATQAAVRASTSAGAQRAMLIESGMHNAETIRGLGMGAAFLARLRLATRWQAVAARRASDSVALFSALSRTFRMFLQSAALALGATLAIEGAISPGTIIAVSIIISRSLAPAEQAIGHWRPFVAARQSWTRLAAMLGRSRPGPATRLPRPTASLAVRQLALMAPGGDQTLLRDVSFSLRAGSALGVIGPSGSGKSTLARALVGLLAPWRGAIRLDGAELAHLDETVRRQAIGYLPQEIELFDATVAENIARLMPDTPSEAIISAARQAGAHEMILSLPLGYDTPVGPRGVALSGGQRQRLALARALFGRPFLIVLDEPNANLDAEGEAALREAIEDAKMAGSIVVAIAHRPSIVAGCDHILVLAEGRQSAFGPRELILRAVPGRDVRVAL